MKLFFDTSALVKYFHDEAGTQQVVSLIMDHANEIWVSDLTRVEFLSALYRKVRTAELGVNQLYDAIVGFDEEWKRFSVQPLGHIVVTEAEKFLRKQGQKYRLRALDALQFASFALLAELDWQFVVADELLASAVAAEGFHVIRVATDKNPC